MDSTKFYPENFPEYMRTSNYDIKFSMKNYDFEAFPLMDGCLCFKENFNR